MSTYADTSFLVSLYVFDVNSARAASSLEHLPRPILLTPLLETEIANALRLRVFRGESSKENINTSSELFERDVRAGIFELKSFGTEIFRRAAQLAKHHTAIFGTRTLDLLHLASADFFQADVFCTFDRTQTKLARALGMKMLAF